MKRCVIAFLAAFTLAGAAQAATVSDQADVVEFAAEVDAPSSFVALLNPPFGDFEVNGTAWPGKLYFTTNEGNCLINSDCPVWVCEGNPTTGAFDHDGCNVVGNTYQGMALLNGPAWCRHPVHDGVCVMWNTANGLELAVDDGFQFVNEPVVGTAGMNTAYPGTMPADTNAYNGFITPDPSTPVAQELFAAPNTDAYVTLVHETLVQDHAMQTLPGTFAAHGDKVVFVGKKAGEMLRIWEATPDGGGGFVPGSVVPLTEEHPAYRRFHRLTIATLPTGDDSSDTVIVLLGVLADGEIAVLRDDGNGYALAAYQNNLGLRPDNPQPVLYCANCGESTPEEWYLVVHYYDTNEYKKGSSVAVVPADREKEIKPKVTLPVKSNWPEVVYLPERYSDDGRKGSLILYYIGALTRSLVAEDVTGLIVPPSQLLSIEASTATRTNERD